MKKSLQLTREMERSMSLLSILCISLFHIDASLGPCSSVYLDFHNGTGGEDASDWTRMLFEMYQNFSKKMEWKSQIISAQYEGSGLRSGTLQIDGDNVSSYFALETGIHRLIRISPFDKNHRRHTSFASVVVTPSIPKEEAPIQIKKEDLIIEIGPGLGVLTNRLLQEAKYIIAVELDKRMVNILQDRFANNIDNKQLEIINDDILKVDLEKMIEEKKKT